MQRFDASAKGARFELSDELGSGAYGSVHVAKRSDNDQEVAVKMLKHMKRGFGGGSLQQAIDVRKIKRELLIMRCVVTCFFVHALNLLVN